MADFSPEHPGAEVLAKLARERFDGAVVWQTVRGSLRLSFAAGRPATVRDELGQDLSQKEQVVPVVRALAVTTQGSYNLERGGAAGQSSIDTLGEIWVAVTTSMPAEALATLFRVRGGEHFLATPLFDKLMPLAQKLGASLGRPAGVVRLDSLGRGASVELQRVIAAQLFLGGLHAAEAPAAPAPAARPVDARTKALIDEINVAFTQTASQDHYGVLGVKRSASMDEVKKAYFLLAKKWHSDSFAGLDLGEARAKVEELFRRISEAQRLLSDQKERQAYDMLLDRKAQGLPTDASTILEAESMFKRAQGLVRRGQAPAALPLLEQVVQMNKGEGEFWVYYGYAFYSVRGSEAVQQAQKHIQHGLSIKPDLDVAYEFLGRIYSLENRFEDATRNLKKAMEMNPKNRDAERELRLVGMRASKKPSTGPKSLGELFGKVFKK